ncbi:MAG TPA: phosphomannomutase/phosphoglucomutase [Acidobacteriota bacterium]|nr:phosphomannomutase/phosphoglucomutase [Acidobacteriota bacterium]
MKDTIFRKYDIRGIVDEDLNEEVVTNIGRAFGSLMRREGRTTIAVGRDARLSSEDYRDALIRGLTSTGCNVVDVGMVPTPLLYFAIHYLETDGGVMITGSHNPPEYNGFKLCRGLMALFDEEITGIRDIIVAGRFENGEGFVRQADVLETYIEKIKEIIKLQRPLKVAVDAGNGVAGLVAPRLYRELGCEVTEFYTEPDGNFPNHHPDPTVPEYMVDLITEIRKGGYDLGIGFDGDGDRLGIVDRDGTLLFGDQLMVLLSREVLSRLPGSKIIFDVKCSQNLVDDIRKHGGEPVMWRTGHSFIKTRMKETGAPIAGEMSGHIFFSDRFFGFDDATYAGARLMEIASTGDVSFLEMLSDLPQVYNTPEIKYPCPEEKKFAAVAQITEYFRKTHEVIDIDGARVNFGDGWALARASNTTPFIILRFEAHSEARLKQIRESVTQVVKSFAG